MVDFAKAVARLKGETMAKNEVTRQANSAKAAAPPKREASRPGYKDVYVVRDASGEGGKAFWTRIGAAFVNRDGSLSVLLDALPVSGRLQIRDHVDREPGDEG